MPCDPDGSLERRKVEALERIAEALGKMVAPEPQRAVVRPLTPAALRLEYEARRKAGARFVSLEVASTPEDLEGRARELVASSELRGLRFMGASEDLAENDWRMRNVS